MNDADFPTMFALAPHGPDTFVGSGPRYTWGSLFGGQIVGQALRAAALTVEPEFAVHSLRAYFIRRGDTTQPVRYEVDRIRNGRGFVTRRVVARQDGGAILKLESSFQTMEPSRDIETVRMPVVPAQDTLAHDPWTTAFDRAFVPVPGRATAWMKSNADLGPDQVLHSCAMAFISDDMPTDAVVRAFPGYTDISVDEFNERWYSASLDHSMWFHRPVQADQWHLYDFSLQSYTGSRGLAHGHVFSADGVHVATVAQEVLVRERRPAAGA